MGPASLKRAGISPASGRGDDNVMCGGFWGGGVLMMALGPLFGLLVIVGLGVLVWELVRRAAPVGGGGAAASDPLTVLQLRLARGEISEDEYRAAVRTLRENH